MKGRLENRRILLCVTGGIAAYKACEVLRRLQAEGAEVRVAMTAAAAEFVTPLTFETLSRNEVATSLFPGHRVVTTRHIRWSEWAECILVCPFGVMRKGKGDRVMIKCDLCAARLHEGRNPACVDACPTRAIKYMAPDEAAVSKRKKYLVQIHKGEA